jgi:hypothetical protein
VAIGFTRFSVPHRSILIAGSLGTRV